MSIYDYDEEDGTEECYVEITVKVKAPVRLLWSKEEWGYDYEADPKSLDQIEKDVKETLEAYAVSKVEYAEVVDYEKA